MMGASDDLQEECHSVMLHDNINVSHLMDHAQQVEEARLRERVEMPRGQDLLIVVLQG